MSTEAEVFVTAAAPHADPAPGTPPKQQPAPTPQLRTQLVAPAAQVQCKLRPRGGPVEEVLHAAGQAGAHAHHLREGRPR